MSRWIASIVSMEKCIFLVEGNARQKPHFSLKNFMKDMKLYDRSMVYKIDNQSNINILLYKMFIYNLQKNRREKEF